MADKKENLVKYGEVVAKCWEDEAYKKRFLEDPESVLTEAGFVVEEGVTYKVVEQPKMVKYLVLPHADTKAGVEIITKLLLSKVEKDDTVIPEGVEIRIIQNTDDVRYMVLPVSPKTLTKQELAMAAGGTGMPVIMPSANTSIVTNVEAVIATNVEAVLGPSMVEPMVAVVQVAVLA